MDRTTLLIAGAIAWTVAAADAVYHVVNGDLLAPTSMAAVAVGYIAIRRTATRLRPSVARTTADVAS